MWQKSGLIFNVDESHHWNKSHAQVPVVDVLEDRLRIYYSTRNENGQSNVSFIETEKNDPSKIIRKIDHTLFELGARGTFDDSGIMPCSILTVNDKKFLYYVGWTTRQSVPYQNAVGLAVSSDGGVSFKKFSEGPVISVNIVEPYFSGTAFVIKENDIFRMWYLSCKRWEIFDGRLEPLYNIKYAESHDGINWNQTGKVAIELAEDEGGLVSSSVVKHNNLYKMWFGKRKKSGYREDTAKGYRIGYAESEDGISWQRKDGESGITISESGWDSQMISYPYVIKENNYLLMFYNGNGFGRTGFGYATMALM